MKPLNFSVHLLIVFCLFMFFQNINAQEKSKVYEKVNVIPEYLGGTKALINSITSEIKYPEEAKKDGIQGKVLVQFIVDKDGKITDPKVIHGIGHDCDAEALRVVKLLKPFKPGMEEGKPVNVKMVLPIMFTLAEKNGK
jgi:protein TonB